MLGTWRLRPGARNFQNFAIWLPRFGVQAGAPFGSQMRGDARVHREACPCSPQNGEPAGLSSLSSEAAFVLMKHHTPSMEGLHV